MRILMALDYYRPNVSGLSLYVERLAQGLASRGHSVTVLTHRHLPDLPKEERQGAVHLVRAPLLAKLGKALLSERQTHPGPSRVANAPYLQPVFEGATLVYRVAGGP